MRAEPHTPIAESERTVDAGLSYGSGPGEPVGGWSTLPVFRVFRNRGAVAGAVILVSLVVVSVLVELTSQDPTAIDMASHMLPPGGDHPFGTDQYGRDVLSRVLY